MRIERRDSVRLHAHGRSWGRRKFGKQRKRGVLFADRAWRDYRGLHRVQQRGVQFDDKSGNREALPRLREHCAQHHFRSQRRSSREGMQLAGLHHRREPRQWHDRQCFEYRVLHVRQEHAAEWYKQCADALQLWARAKFALHLFQRPLSGDDVRDELHLREGEVGFGSRVQLPVQHFGVAYGLQAEFRQQSD